MSPALSGDFLSLVNSAAFSRGQFIYNLDQALPRLGRKKIQSILFLNASKMSLPETPLFETVSKEIISQSQAVAKICRLMSPFFQVDSNEAFLAGLLHNIGKIGLLKQISKHYNLPEDLDVEYHQSLFNNILPAFESRAAQQICQYWKLEHKIVETIRLHESLDSMDRSAIIPENLKLIALVNLAVYLSRILGYGNSLKTTDVFGLVSAQILKFHDNEQSRQLLQKVHGSFQESLDTVKNIA
jgi:HD-like signal output (HDOD) protein